MENAPRWLGGGGAFSSGPTTAGVDINLIPFPMIDHIDILKDGASAVYGSDAVAGVINIFLLHKFRGLEIGGSYGNTNMGASNDAGEREGWLKAGTGDDKTDIVVIADFYDRAAIYSRDRDISSNAVRDSAGADLIFAVADFPGRHRSRFPLDPALVFQRELSAAALSSECRNFSILYRVFLVPHSIQRGQRFSNMGLWLGLDGDYVFYNYQL